MCVGVTACLSQCIQWGRHGSVLSPLLFAVYLDELLVSLVWAVIGVLCLLVHLHMTLFY